MFTLPTRILAYVLCGVILLLGGSLLKEWYFPNYEAIIAGQAREPIVLTEVKVIREAKKVIQTRPVALPVLTDKQQRSTADKFSLDMSVVSLLTQVEVPKAPDGGEAAVTITPEGSVGVTFKPNRRSFWELGGDWEIGGGLVAHGLEQGVRLHGAKDLLRAGRINLKIEADIDLVGSEINSEVALLGVYRW